MRAQAGGRSMPICASGRYKASVKSKRPVDSAFPSTSKATDTWVEFDIVLEITEGRRNRLFTYAAYLTVLNEGTKPL